MKYIKSKDAKRSLLPALMSRTIGISTHPNMRAIGEGTYRIPAEFDTVR